MQIKQVVILCLVLFFAVNAFAEEKSPWSGEGEVGVLVTTGNTESESLNSKLKIDYEPAQWFNKANAEAIYSADKVKNDDGTTSKKKSAEKYLISDKIGYNFNENNYIFSLASYDYDFFSGYYYQITLNAGYGRRLIKTDKTTLDVEVGPGYRLSSVREAGGGDDDKELIFRVAGTFKRKLTDTSSFQQDISLETGSENTITKSVSAIQAQIIGALAMKLSYTVKHTSNPPEHTSDKIKKTDTETALTLVYSF